VIEVLMTTGVVRRAKLLSNISFIHSFCKK